MVTSDEPLVQWSDEALAEECARQSSAFRHSSDCDESFCLELFRRAVEHNDQQAWAAIYAQFHKLVLSWVQSRLGGEIDVTDDVVIDTFDRFTHALMSGRFRHYDHMQSLMAYMKRCACAAAYDCDRRTRRMAQVVESLDDEGVSERLVTSTNPVELEVIQSQDAQWMWQRVMSHCWTDDDRLLARRVLVEGMRPDQVFRAHPARFASVQAVYQTLRNLRDRLRRDESLAAVFQAAHKSNAIHSDSTCHERAHATRPRIGPLGHVSEVNG